MAKKHKKKRYYTISVTSNISADKTKYYRARFNILSFCIAFSLIITVIAAGLTLYEVRQMNSMEDQIKVFREIITKQEAQIAELGKENAELTSRNGILLATVGRQEIANAEQEEISREKALPSGFPLTDSTTVAEADPEKENPEQMIVFNMSDASDVVACGDGVVIGVREDQDFGNCIIIDHGNGYVTYYKNAAEPKVKEGDEIVRGAILFVGGLEDNILGYMVTFNGEYVDPLSVLEING